MSLGRELYCIIWFLLTYATVTITTSLATSHWRGQDGYNEGMFEKCRWIDSGCSFIRFFDRSTDNEFDVIRILMLGACALLLISSFLSCISVCVERNVSIAIVILNTIAFLCCIPALSLYARHYWDSSLNFEWSYALAWSGCVSLGLGEILVILDRCFSSEEEKEREVNIV